MNALFFFLLGRFFLSLEVDGDDVSAAMPSTTSSIAVDALRFADVVVFVDSALTLVLVEDFTTVFFWDDVVFGTAAVVPVAAVIAVAVVTAVALSAMNFDENGSAVGLNITVIA
jgi:uncharacterized membrane protein YagU involved in acid resistance